MISFDMAIREQLSKQLYEKRLDDMSNAVIFKGCFADGLMWYILRGTLGTPVAYIQAPKGFDREMYDKHEEDIDCHGGATFFGYPYWNPEDRSLCIGWDYAHEGDYIPPDGRFFGGWDGKRYTIVDVLRSIETAHNSVVNIMEREALL